MADAQPTLNETNAQLQARINELEAQLGKETAETIVTPATADAAKEIPDRLAHEFSRISRALLVASVEHLKVSAEAIDIFAQEASNLDTNTSDSAQVVLASIPRSITTGIVKAVDHALDGPSRAITEFYKSYTAPAPPKTTGNKSAA